MLNKDDLFKPPTNEQDVEIPGKGTVRIRALTRAEALQVRGKSMPIDQLEQKLLSWAMIEPKLTENEVRKWQEMSVAGELEVVTQAIAKLSGMETTSPKEAMHNFRA